MHVALPPAAAAAGLAVGPAAAPDGPTMPKYFVPLNQFLDSYTECLDPVNWLAEKKSWVSANKLLHSYNTKGKPDEDKKLTPNQLAEYLRDHRLRAGTAEFPNWHKTSECNKYALKFNAAASVLLA